MISSKLILGIILLLLTGYFIYKIIRRRWKVRMILKQNNLKLARDVMGLHPLPVRFKQAMISFKGEEDVPKSTWDLSSLKQLYPQISPKLWRGEFYLDRKIIISNLFNHTQTPIEEGWSVSKTQTKDFRGKDLTYNSHNGTDFAIPIGSTVTTAAPGAVVAIMSEFNRGGLKIFIDHGNGLMTCYAHLAKSLVKVGDILSRAQPIAISGYSGLDGTVTYPFGIPHIHFNVWLNSDPTDPFSFNNQPSLWRGGEMPAFAGNEKMEFTASTFKEELVNKAIEDCKTVSVQEILKKIEDIRERAFHTIIQMNYYPTRFLKRVNLYGRDYPRLPLLDLPFSREHFDGVVFLDEIIKSN